MSSDVAPGTLERLTSLGHLSAGVGHHVINAFSAIVSNAELLRHASPTTKTAEPAVLAETIINTALEAATVARRLIDYTRPVTAPEPARTTSSPRTVVLNSLVTDAADRMRSAVNSGATIETTLAEIGPIRGDGEQLALMLDCLLKNAVESLASEPGVICIATSTDDRGWNVVEVSDTGKGMTNGVKARAVEPFFSTKPGHLGVGLSVANGIWRRHRGTLSILTRPDEGTRIRLCIEPLRG